MGCGCASKSGDVWDNKFNRQPREMRLDPKHFHHVKLDDTYPGDVGAANRRMQDINNALLDLLRRYDVVGLSQAHVQSIEPLIENVLNTSYSVVSSIQVHLKDESYARLCRRRG